MCSELQCIGGRPQRAPRIAPSHPIAAALVDLARAGVLSTGPTAATTIGSDPQAIPLLAPQCGQAVGNIIQYSTASTRLSLAASQRRITHVVVY